MLLFSELFCVIILYNFYKLNMITILTILIWLANALALGLIIANTAQTEDEL